MGQSIRSGDTLGPRWRCRISALCRSRALAPRLDADLRPLPDLTDAGRRQICSGQEVVRTVSLRRRAFLRHMLGPSRASRQTRCRSFLMLAKPSRAISTLL